MNIRPVDELAGELTDGLINELINESVDGLTDGLINKLFKKSKDGESRKTEILRVRRI